MAEVKHGNVTIQLPFELPERSGKLTLEQMRELSKPPRGVGLMCDASATALEHVGPKLVVTQDITPAALREAGEKAEAIDLFIESVDVILAKLRQANLLLDAHAFDLLRKLNEQVKAQGKFDAEIAREFRTLSQYMTHKHRSNEPTTT